MSDNGNKPAADKLLFTPGPLTTSRTVKEAMLRDLGSRDSEFIEMVRSIRERLLAIGSVTQAEGYEAIPIQGSGTFGIEAVVSSAIPADGKLLVLVNGAYGQRIVGITERYGISVVARQQPENQPFSVESLAGWLAEDAAITHVAVVHCETSSGVMNPVVKLGAAVKAAGRSYIVDAMSSFGGVPLNVSAAQIDFLISSSNKCIEGVPGFSFVIAERDALAATKGQARTVSLDLFAQWDGLEKSGQFRFTPPTHVLLAFDQALRELEEEGGPAERAQRYRRNHQTLVAGMRKLGFKEYVPEKFQSWIITTFRYPDDPKFDFNDFYQKLSDRGMVIYPGKLTEVDCFRIGNIGRIDEADIRTLLEAIGSSLQELGMLS